MVDGCVMSSKVVVAGLGGGRGLIYVWRVCFIVKSQIRRGI